MKSLYEVENYIEWITEKIKENQKIRGYKTHLAKAAHVHNSYFSRVLQGVVQLNSDQGFGLTRYWGMNSKDTHYFLRLIDYSRASTIGLKNLIKRELEEMKKEASRLANRVQAKAVHTTGSLNVYYSAWYHSAIHMALTLPNYNSVEKISEILKLNQETVLHSLNILNQLGLAEKRNGKWSTAINNQHLAADEEFANLQHMNWRLKSAQIIQERRPGNPLNYSGVHTLSTADFERLRGRILDFVTEIRSEIQKSPEEKLITFSIDWMEI